MHLISFFLGCSFVILVSSNELRDVNNLSSSSIDGIKYLSEEDKCIANIRKLIPDRIISRNLGGIVGIGWDALTNTATLPVFPQTYRLCQTVPDGDFMIPDGVVVIPIKEANLHKSSEMYESFSKYKSSVGGSLSVSAGGGVPGIASVSGSVSVETKVGKEHMEKHKQTAFTNTIEYRAFTLIGTESAGFDEVFEERLNDIFKAIKGGNKLLAQYEAESIIADYGTHVTNKALAGASVTMLSFATTTGVEDKHSFALKVSAEFHSSFLGAVDMGMKASASYDSSDDSGSTTSTSQSYIISKGGPDVNRLLSGDGDKMHIDSVVGLTREGMPLYSFIHPQAMKDKKGKEWDDRTTLMVQDLLYNATQEYIRHNTIPGCSDSSDSHYFNKANVDDFNACTSTSSKFVYSGYYQTCEYIESYSKAHPQLQHGNQCDQYMHPNPVTNEYSCPGGFPKPITFYVTYKHRAHNVKVNGCNDTECLTNYTITDRIKVSAYICYYGSTPYATFFGGIFQGKNIFSDDGRCARGYEEYPILYNHKICWAKMKYDDDFDVVDDYFKATHLAYGGWIGCGNETERNQCLPGHSRYYLTTINNCPYYYCAAISDDSVLLPYYKEISYHSPIRPPYIDRDLAFTQTRLEFQHEMDEMEEEAVKKMLTKDGKEIGEIVNIN